MKPTATSRFLAAGALAVILCAGAKPSNAAYTYTAGLAGLSEYNVKLRPYRYTFGPTWGASGAMIHELKPWLAFRSSIGWARRERDIATVSILEEPTPGIRQRVDVLPVTAGLRLSLPGGRGDRPFIDVSPAVVWSRWREKFIGGNVYGNYFDRVMTPRTRVGAGIEYGFGVGFRVNEGVRPEFSVRYLQASRIDESPLPTLGPGRVEGVRQWSAGISLAWTR